MNTLSSSTGITLKSGQTRKVSTIVPYVSIPQSYYVSFAVLDNLSKSKSNDISFRYYIDGISASIRSLSLDSDFYESGDSAKVSFMWSKIDSSFLKENKTQSATTSIVAQVALFNDKRERCAVEERIALTKSDEVVDIFLTITQRCKNPEVSVTLLNDSGKVLDSKTFAVTTQVKESKIFSNTQEIVLAFMAFVFGIIGFLMYRKKFLLSADTTGDTKKLIFLPLELF